MTDQPAGRDAEPAPPWREEMGPPPRTRGWPPDRRPRLRIRINGVWRRAIVLQRQDWPDGRTSYLLDVQLPTQPPIPGAPDALDYYAGTYWWDPATMRAE